MELRTVSIGKFELKIVKIRQDEIKNNLENLKNALLEWGGDIGKVLFSEVDYDLEKLEKYLLFSNYPAGKSLCLQDIDTVIGLIDTYLYTKRQRFCYLVYNGDSLYYLNLCKYVPKTKNASLSEILLGAVCVECI